MKQILMKHRVPISAAVMVLLCLAVFAFSSCTTTTNSARQDASDNDTKIGVLVPNSGFLAQYYEQLDAGIKAYQDRYLTGKNSSGVEIDLVYYDMKSDIQTAVKGCQYLINRVGVDLILGPMTTSSSREVIPICDKAGIPVVPIWATARDLVAQSPAAFRVVFSNYHTGSLLDKFSAENLNGIRAAVISADNLHMKESYDGFSETFLELNRGSGRIMEIIYDGDAEDIGDQVAGFDEDIVYLNFLDAIRKWSENLDVIKAIELRDIDVIYLGDMTWKAIDRSIFYDGISPVIY